MTAWSRRFRIAVIGAGALAALAVSAVWWLPALLVAPPVERDADAAILIADDEPTEAARDLVLSLFRSGKVHSVACASEQAFVGLYGADAVCRQLGERGIPGDRRFIVHLSLTQCDREMIPALIALARREGWTSVIVVVRPERSREWRRLAVGEFAGAGIQASVTFAERERDQLVEQWWRTHGKAQRIVGSSLAGGLDFFYRQCR